MGVLCVTNQCNEAIAIAAIELMAVSHPGGLFPENSGAIQTPDSDLVVDHTCTPKKEPAWFVVSLLRCHRYHELHLSQLLCDEVGLPSRETRFTGN